MTTRVGVVCVGAGWVTANRHLPALLRDGRARVVGIIDSHPERAEALARRHELPHWGTRVDEPWVAQAGCASVGTPPATHAEVVLRLLNQGLHVLCEKPLAATVGDAEAMVAMATERGRVLAVVHNFQFASAMERARRLLAQGALGDLTGVYAVQLSNPSRRLPHWYPSLEGGLFYDEAPHLLYLLRGLVGELRPSSVAGRLNRSVSPAQVTQLDAVFDHPHIWAQLTMNFSSPVSEWQLVLMGTRQLVAVDIFRDISVLLPNDGAHEARQVLRTTLRGVGEHMAGVVRSGMGHVSGRLLYGNETVARRFLDAVCDRGDLAGLHGRDGLAVVKTIHELLARAAG
jgi:scyllo-inositol 2-dehydrogenase (NADP+)